MGMNYKEAGVDIDLGDKFVEKIKNLVRSTHNENVVAGVGGFAALYKMDQDRFLVASTDGVGTKIKLAIELGFHETIGIDLVAMCVNDLLCTGARPLFFLDYFASGKLDLGVGEAVLKGIVEGCHQGKMALIGGETAEMPGMYQDGDYDLAGFSVGEVFQKDIIDGSQIKPGDTLVGIPSSGFHSNGFSLVRKAIDSLPSSSEKEQLKSECLTPTAIYVDLIKKINSTDPKLINGIANITGGGFHNIPRMNDAYTYSITSPPKIDELPSFMRKVLEITKLSKEDAYKTFNMGVGLVIATNQPESLQKIIDRSWIIGTVISKNKHPLILDF